MRGAACPSRQRVSGGWRAGSGVVQASEDLERRRPAPQRGGDDQRLELASLPSPQPIPAADPIDPTLSEETGREAVLEAWHARPLDDRRAALARLIHEIVRSPGAAEDRRPYHAP